MEDETKAAEGVVKHVHEGNSVADEEDCDGIIANVSRRSTLSVVDGRRPSSTMVDMNAMTSVTQMVSLPSSQRTSLPSLPNIIVESGEDAGSSRLIRFKTALSCFSSKTKKTKREVQILAYHVVFSITIFTLTAVLCTQSSSDIN